ncbi:N-6 DNA methylase [Brevibacillus sp. VP]|uniref:N-6 DNA methylase n=1 Tax=unclassified Brevibacillus TaxID=2684853 RepID=UPI0013752D6D|nr:N-6 DNA methylase [Brevibacillus sp. VP]
MSESLSQGLPSLVLDQTWNIKLYKCNDISFQDLKKEGFNCSNSKKKPDQLIAQGIETKKVIIAIEDKVDDSQLEEAVNQIKENYLDALPETKFFIARAGSRIKVLYRLKGDMLIEINTLNKGFQVTCFGPRVITGENEAIIENLKLFASQALKDNEPANNDFEINPQEDYYNPIKNKSRIIKSLWQKIFVCTGEQAHKCLATFVELLVYKGISDAGLLPKDYRISTLAKDDVEDSLWTYTNSIRTHISNRIFPCMPEEPGIIDPQGFAFTGQETTFKSVLNDLETLGNIAHKKLDPDFKRRVLETFLGSSNREGKIKNGQHITPRNVVQTIWRMANPSETARIIDLACGVGGFVLEGLNYPFDFNYRTYNALGIDKSREMITLAKANMVLHLLDVIAENPTINHISEINRIINRTFLYTDRNGTGTLAEITKAAQKENEFVVNHPADYVFANVPFFSSGVSEIDKSLEQLGNLNTFYSSSGLGIESRFIKYIVEQIQNMDPGMAFVIVPEGILKNVNSKTRDLLKSKTDMLGIVAFPKGMFENNNWKTYMLIFQKKTDVNKYSKVMLYNVEDIGVSLDQFRAPIEKDDLITMEAAWEQRLAGESADPKCAFVTRTEFNNAKKWSELFDVFNNEEDDSISVNESVGIFGTFQIELENEIAEMNKNYTNMFNYENSVSIQLSDANYFIVGAPAFKPTIRYAKLNKGKYPLYSSQISGPVDFMFSDEFPPVLFENENRDETSKKKIISWNIKGDAAKDVRVHDEPFYGTENRGLIEIINPSQVNIEYLELYLKENLVRLGRFSRANEAHVGKVRDILIEFPANENGLPDWDKQLEIVAAYKEIQSFKLNMIELTQRMKDTVEKINILK